jgi:lysophospholipase L1-like esterase
MRNRIFVVSWLFVIVGGSARAADTYTMGAIGDSISAGFDAQRLGDNRELSWSTGDSAAIDSHLKRLGAKLGRPVSAFNEAVTGSVVADLDAQVTRILQHDPDYVTVDIGANDLCNWTADYETALAAYEQTLRAALNRIIQARPDVKIMLAPVPDVHNLYEVAVSQPGCQERWDLIGICKPLLASSNTDSDRAAFVGRWEAINATLDKIALDYPANVLHDPSIAHTGFTWVDVSTIDCFHPSVSGQNLLADKTWLIVERLRL